MRTLVILFISIAAYTAVAGAATWQSVTGTVTGVSTGWQADTVCVYLSTGDVAKLDLTTETGNTQLSIALTAHATGKSLLVYFDEDGVPEGGCNTGTSILPMARYLKVTD